MVLHINAFNLEVHGFITSVLDYDNRTQDQLEFQFISEIINIPSFRIIKGNVALESSSYGILLQYAIEFCVSFFIV